MPELPSILKQTAMVAASLFRLAEFPPFVAPSYVIDQTVQIREERSAVYRTVVEPFLDIQCLWLTREYQFVDTGGF